MARRFRWGPRRPGWRSAPTASLLYVANGNDTVSVINTKTRAVVTTLQIDTQRSETNYHIVAVRSDGSLVVTDWPTRACAW